MNAQKRRIDLLVQENFQDYSEAFADICRHSTRTACDRARSKADQERECDKIHFRAVVQSHTDPSLGDCSFLNTCHKLGSCRFLHYELEDPGPISEVRAKIDTRDAKRRKQGDFEPTTNGITASLQITQQTPPQWLDCDLRALKPNALGKFDIIMADPPWSIGQELPYGTMSDDEMKRLPISSLQDEGGLLFLWVTGRAMEIGRDCLNAWGYKRIDEIVWVKTSHLRRLVRTGRTGHWLNHSKEHCLVAYKLPRQRNPLETAQGPTILDWINRGLDTDVIVSEVRETSKKPDEIYDLIYRLCPSARRLELFGRKHNTRPGWLTLGNQLGGSHIEEESLRQRLQETMPEYL